MHLGDVSQTASARPATKPAVCSPVSENDSNIDHATVQSFGNEWEKFTSFSDREIENIGDAYFDLLTEDDFSKIELALDAGCGSGRWTRYLASRVGRVEAVDPSSALDSAAQEHSDLKNVNFVRASISDLPYPNDHFDLIACIGVLHHMPDTEAGLASLRAKLKPGGMIVLYLYYSLDNRGALYRGVFRVSNVIRKYVSSLPRRKKQIACDAVAFTVYLPLALLTRLISPLSPRAAWNIPLAAYSNKSINVMRNDALDRFGTPLERRFSKQEIQSMLHGAGFRSVSFSDQRPYWHCTAVK